MSDQCDRVSGANPASRIERRNAVAAQGHVVADPTSEFAHRLAAKFGSVVEQNLFVGEHRVEDANDSRIEAVVAVIGHRHRLGVALGFVVHAPRADRVDVAPVGLGLRVNERVAVDLRGRGEEETCTLGLGETEAIVRAESADLQDLDRDPLEIGWRRGAGEMHDGVDVARHPHVRADVVFDEREPAPPEQRLDIGDGPGDQIVDRHHLVATVEQRPAEV